MINKLLVLLVISVFSQTVFSQSDNSEKRPRAYLISSGEKRPAISRPRVVKTDANEIEKSGFKSVEQNFDSKTRNDFGLERQVFDLINKQRIQLGFAALAWNDDVAAMARRHSENMASFKFFSHTDLQGLMVNDRADALGIRKWRSIGENIAYNRGYENPAQSAVEKWMLSPAHRDNLLNNRWQESGIGIAVTEDGTYYFTEVFLLRK